jgi:rRNA-processing protein FCF1
MAKTTEKIVITAAVIDELAALREQIKSLAKREKQLVEALREDCNGVDTVYRGDHYVLKTKFVTQERLDTAAAREELGEDWCAANTKTVVSMNIDATEVL